MLSLLLGKVKPTLVQVLLSCRLELSLAIIVKLQVLGLRIGVEQAGAELCQAQVRLSYPLTCLDVAVVEAGLS